jgi:hypothetical protein
MFIGPDRLFEVVDFAIKDNDACKKQNGYQKPPKQRPAVAQQREIPVPKRAVARRIDC